MGFLARKKVLIVGVASKLSIAAGIATAMHREGAELAFTAQNDKLKDRVVKLANQWDSDTVWVCDVSNDDEVAAVAEQVKNHWGQLDVLVHAVAYAPANELEGDYVANATREGFKIAHDVSSYSLTALVQALHPLMTDNASVLTLTYQGSERVIANYNVMGLAKASLEANVRYLASGLGPNGIRVNAISAGPIRTLAASGIKHFRKMLDQNEKIAPLRRNVTIEDVGNTAAFLASDLAGGITGEVIHVDAGFRTVGMAMIDEETS